MPGASLAEQTRAIAPRGEGLTRALREWWRLAVSAARLAVGVPDYDSYIAHLRRHHPERTPLDYASFFAERLNARYAKGRSRCC